MDVDKARPYYLRHLGNLLRAMQTRWDIGFSQIDVAAACPYVLTELREARGMIKGSPKRQRRCEINSRVFATGNI